MTENETVTSDLPGPVVSAVRNSRQLTLETAKKFAEALSAAAQSVSGHLPGRQLAHRLPAPPFADGLPKLPKLPETETGRAPAPPLRRPAARRAAQVRRRGRRRAAPVRRRAGLSCLRGPHARRDRT